MDVSIKHRYIPPRVLQETEVLLERNLLVGSTVDNMNKIETIEQEIERYDMDDSSFNFKWE